MTTNDLEDVDQHVNLPREEEKVLEFWKKIDAFQTSLKRSEGRPEYSFYDGPPFATGLPHYGHILTGTIKDVVTRYAHQTGHYVKRRFGWDCHGLPIEFEIEKELGIKTKEEVLQFGIGNYNDACRNIVMRFSEEWRKTITRLGRWIDFDNDYKTMNLSFMESVWWVFKQLHEKNLVYRGFKVMPYSTGCTTPLANFEVSLNYKDVNDPELTVSFPLVDEENTHLLIWTTTPWTLPSNLAICVHPTMTYLKIKETSTGKHYIIAEPRAKDVFKGKPFTKVDSFPGSKLKGRKYVPIFNYFADRADANDKVFTVCVDEYVTSTSGTGLVHQAPGFGEDDLRVCVAHGVAESKDLPCPIDGSGRFIAPVNDYLGRYIKDCDNDIAANIKSRDRLFNKGTLIHSYPFCWRSDTPLIYRAIPSWFVEVTKIKQDLLTNNQNTYWVPSNVRDAKFHNWLQDARDWSVSRSRYWGTPLPIWVSDDGEEIVVVGSVEELQQLTGTTDIKDIHRQHIDHLTIPSRQGKGTLRRVEEVFDCWFESGSMPYAQSHYPFENQDKFHNSFPADFIAEGIDQTRGWFYTLMVLGTALFNTAPFKNLVVNGLVLASDKKKMSKRLKNYDDPVDVVNMHGADALRLYLINSPVVRAENLCFKTEGVKDVVKDVFLQWVNAYRLFVQNAKRYKNAHQELFTSVEAAAFKPTNVMDKWVISMSQSLVAFVHQEMKAYRLYTVTPKLVDTVQQLTNWYVRMNRKRLKGVESKQEWYQSLCTLFNVLYTLIRTMSPFTPFLTEMMYQNLRNLVPSDQREDSIHYLDMPQFDPTLVDESIEKAVSDMQLVVVNGRILRDRSKLNLRQTVSEYVVVHHDEQFIQNVLSLQSYIKEELNCVELKATSQVQQFVKLQASAEKKLLGKRFGKKLAEYSGAIDKLSHDQISKFLKESTIEVNGESFDHQDIKVAANFIGDAETFMDVRCENGSLVLLNFVLTDELRQAGLVRSTCARVQQLRKKAGLVVEDVVDVYFVDQSKSGVLKSRQSEMEEYLSNMKLFYEEELKDQALIEEEEDGIKIILVKH